MSIKSNLLRAVAIGAAVTAVSAGAAFAAVATSSVNVRTGPGTGYRVVDQLSRGESVAVTDQEGGWCEISHRGPDGWVSCSYLAQDRYVRPPRYSRYDRYYDDEYYDDRPAISFGFGFGSPRPHYPRPGAGFPPGPPPGNPPPPPAPPGPPPVNPNNPTGIPGLN